MALKQHVKTRYGRPSEYHTVVLRCQENSYYTLKTVAKEFFFFSDIVREYQNLARHTRNEKDLKLNKVKSS